MKEKTTYHTSGLLLIKQPKSYEKIVPEFIASDNLVQHNWVMLPQL